MNNRIHFSVPFLVVAIIFALFYWFYNNTNADTSQDSGSYTAGMMSNVNWNNLGKKKGE